jgi:photosystem II stability/assembly factor-like uncharacterized protein
MATADPANKKLFSTCETFYCCHSTYRKHTTIRHAFLDEYMNMKRIHLLLALMLSSTCGSMSHVSAQWVETPVHGTMTTLAVSYTNSASPMLFVATDGNGVFLSPDSGSSWKPVNTGLTNLRVQGLAVSGTNTSTPLLFASTAYIGNGVFLSTDDGATWRSVNNGLTTLNVDAIAVSDTNLFVAGTAGGVFRSTNNGMTWSTASNGLSPYLTVFAFAVADTNTASPMLFAGTYGSGVYLSRDEGSNWIQVNNGLTNTSIFALEVIGANTESQTLFAGTIGYVGAYGGVFRSTNNGTLWTSESTGLLNSDVYALAATGQSISAILFAGTDSGVFLSPDSGGHWMNVSDGLPPQAYVSSIAIIGANIFVAADTTNSSGSTGGSVWRRPLSEMIASNTVTMATSSNNRIQSNPNPFTQSTTISFQSETENTKVSIVNVLGVEVAQLFDGRLNPGKYSFTWNAGDVGPGVYECVVQQGETMQHVKVLLSR